MRNYHTRVYSHLRSEKKTYSLGAALFAFSLLVGMSALYATYVVQPSVSELAFTEHSTLGTGAGSVIPASCESGVNHNNYEYNKNGTIDYCAPVCSSDQTLTQTGTLYRCKGYETYPSGDNTFTVYVAPTAWQSTPLVCIQGMDSKPVYECVANTTPTAATPTTAPSVSSLVGTGCTIAAGQSDCPTRVQWSIANSNAPRVYFDGDLSWAFTGASGDETTYTFTAGPGTHTYTAWDGKDLLTVEVTKVCALGTTWADGICALPSLIYLTGTGCTIPLNENDCLTRVEWSIANPHEPRVYFNGDLSWAYTGPSGDETDDIFAGGPGTHTYTAWDGVDLETATVTKACATDSAWDGSKCAAVSGTVTANPTTCTIAANTSTCSSIISFTTLNTLEANVWVDGSVLVGGASSGSATYSAVTKGTKTFSLRNGNQSTGTLLSQVSVTGVCATGTKWDGSICAPVSGTISANPLQCTIAQGETTCSTDVTYATANTDGAQVFAGTNLFRNGLSGTNVPFNNVPYGPLTLTLRNNASDGDTTQLASVTVSGTCGGDNQFDETKSICVQPTPVIEGNITPTSVPYDGPVSVTWSIKNPNNSCKIQATLQEPAVCNAACKAEVATKQTALNTTLSTSKTNQNDPNGSRTMSTALTTTISGIYAKGVKTINVEYSTEFQFTCDTTGQPGTVAMPAKAVKRMIYVTDKNEG